MNALHKMFIWNGVVVYSGFSSDTGPHKHHALQITFSLDKSFSMKVSHQDYIQYEAIIVASNKSHVFESQNGNYLFIYLDPNTIEAKCITQYVLRDKESLGIDKSDFYDSLKWFYQSINSTKPCEQIRFDLNILLQKLFGCKPLIDPGEPRIEQVKSIINKNLSEICSIKEMADHVNLSESRLIHLFKEHMGLPIRKFILWNRIKQAIEELSKGGNLTQIAYSTGFSDSAHFSKTFSSMFGISPSEIFKKKNGIEIINCSQ